MQITTIRLPESMKAAIEQEAEEQELSPTEYMRSILRNRRQITIEDTPEESQADYAQLEDRVTELEQRLNRLEEPEPRDTNPTREATETTHTDLLEYVREHGPVKAGELKEHCYPEDHYYAPSTWWTKEAKDTLKESNATYRNNIGWSFR